MYQRTMIQTVRTPLRRIVLREHCSIPVLRAACAVCVLLAFFPGSAEARGWSDMREYVDFELFVNDRMHLLHNFYDSGQKSFDQDMNLHITYINPKITMYPTEYLRGVFELEGEFWLDMDDDVLEHDVEFRNAYVQLRLPSMEWITLLGGRQYLSTTGGLIYDDSSPVLRIDADFERGFQVPLSLNVLVTEVDSDSPYVHAELKYGLSFFESVTVSYGAFRDTHSGIAGIFDYMEQQRRYSSRGTVQWFGISLKKFIWDVYLRATVLYEKGSISLRNRDEGRRSLSTRGYLFDINLDYSLSEDLSFSLFLFLASGDGKPFKGTFRSFIAIDPYIDKTNIFFNGGIDSQFSSDNVGLSGMQVPGVIAPGLSATWRCTPQASVRFSCAYLLPHRGTGKRGSVYGWEADMMGIYSLTDSLQVFGELNVFDPGEYFRAVTAHREHISVEIIFGLNYFFNY